jgi:Arc/MetJ-type ribon-helix-helix transcriptional regulator
MTEGNGDKGEKEKKGISATVDEDKVVRIDALVDKGKYRNRSHAIEEGMRLVLEKDAKEEAADGARTN